VGSSVVPNQNSNGGRDAIMHTEVKNESERVRLISRVKTGCYCSKAYRVLMKELIVSQALVEGFVF